MNTNALEVVYPDHECILYLLDQKYIRNELPTHILRDHGYRFPLHLFCCYCVGMVEGEKNVECIQFIMKTHSEKITQMSIRWFHPTHRKKYVTLWVNSGASLKKNFFLFTDKLNFFRSTFVYYPEMQTYFRLSSLLDYIELPLWNSTDEKESYQKIYQTPFKFSLLCSALYLQSRQSTKKRKNVKKIQEANEHKGKRLKREKLFRKNIERIARNDFDYFMHRKYPELFQEINRII